MRASLPAFSPLTVRQTVFRQASPAPPFLPDRPHLFYRHSYSCRKYIFRSLLYHRVILRNLASTPGQAHS